jgi:hypothetical protein|tara:strand:+ start:2901 stop:3320 length:420 start_codon:yes stop_codon:yes gene_type:complete
MGKENKEQTAWQKYYDKNKDEIVRKKREKRSENPEKYAAQSRKYYQKNKEMCAMKQMIRDKSRHYEKTIISWQAQGIKLRSDEDWLSVYLHYITLEECSNCAIELKNGCNLDSRNLDHSHETCFIRDVMCSNCNRLAGK